MLWSPVAPSKKDTQKEIVKEVKKEIQTPASGKSATPATPKSFSYLEELHKQTEALRKKVRARKTELEKLETIPGWTIWGKPVKRKLKNDF